MRMGMAQQVTAFDPDILESGLFRIVRKALEYHKDIQILFHSDEYLCSSDRYLVIAGSRGLFYLNNLDFSRIVSAHHGEYRVRGITTRQLPGHWQQGRPADEFFWRYGLSLSQGQLLPGCHASDVMQLRQWPNFTRLPMTPNSYRIAALLTARPMTLDTAQRLLDIDHQELYRFCSAAWLAGYLRQIHSTGKTPPVQFRTHEHIGIIRMLINRFRQPR